MKFPLGAGHVFGVANSYQVTVHDGSEDISHEMGLRDWQSRYKRDWDRDQPVTGRFDGPTQRACISVQRARGLNYSQVLDADTWSAVFNPAPPAPEAPESPVEESGTLPPTPEPVKPPTAPLGPSNAPRRGRPPKQR